MRVSTEVVAGSWLRKLKTEDTKVRDGDSTDIAILERVVFSIAYDRGEGKICVQILFLVSAGSIDGD